MNSASGPVQVLVFVDAGFFAPVVRHFRSLSEAAVRVSGSGLLSWVRGEVDRRLGRGSGGCVIGEARLFLPATDRSAEGAAEPEECIDGEFGDAGFVLQKAPAGSGAAGHQLAIAVEVMDQAYTRLPEVVVLVAGFGGLAPLVRKLTAAGISVMVPQFDVPVVDRTGASRRMRTAPVLSEAATWTVSSGRALEDRGRAHSGLRDTVTGASRREARGESLAQPQEDLSPPPPGPLQGAVLELREKMGFLLEDWNGRKLFFHHTAVADPSFERLGAGDRVEYERGQDPRGRVCAVSVRRLAAAEVSAAQGDGPRPGGSPAEEKPLESSEPSEP